MTNESNSPSGLKKHPWTSLIFLHSYHLSPTLKLGCKSCECLLLKKAKEMMIHLLIELNGFTREDISFSHIVLTSTTATSLSWVKPNPISSSNTQVLISFSKMKTLFQKLIPVVRSVRTKETLSFQQMQDHVAVSGKVDELVSQLVTANLDKEILQHELLHTEEQFHEASKTIELLKKFVMLLEMEKEVAMEENANLGYKVTSLLEENRELATEALFMKNEAVGLARCVLQMRDDHFHKVCILQNRIYSLQTSGNPDPDYDKVSTGCFGLDKHKTKKNKGNKTEEKTGLKWLKKLNNINLFTKCNPKPISCCSIMLRFQLA